MHPARAGFRAVCRQPAVIAGEIAWRWAFGAAAWGLVLFTVHRILVSVDISEAEYLIARRSSMFLIADACARIIYEVLPDLVRAAAILVPAIAVLWVLAATAGRAITLKALLPTGDPRSSRLASLASLHLLRAVFVLATLLALLATLVLTGRLLPIAVNPALAGMIWGFLAALVVFFWALLNWFLSLAPIFIVRDGRAALASIADSLALYRRHRGTYAATAAWFGLLRFVLFCAACVLAIFAAAAAGSAPRAIALSLVIALIYFAVADFLYITRLAAYMILDEPTPLPALENQSLSPQSMPASPLP